MRKPPWRRAPARKARGLLGGSASAASGAIAASSSSSSAGSSRADELWRHVGAAVGPAGELTPLLEKVRDCAWHITDRDVAGLDAGALYEAVLPVAFATADEKRRGAHEAIDAH